MGIGLLTNQIIMVTRMLCIFMLIKGLGMTRELTIRRDLCVHCVFENRLNLKFKILKKLKNIVIKLVIVGRWIEVLTISFIHAITIFGHTAIIIGMITIITGKITIITGMITIITGIITIITGMITIITGIITIMIGIKI